MSLRRYMQEVTPEEHLMWLAHLSEEFNRPSRTDYYLMQAAAEMRRWMAKNPQDVQVEHLRLQFGNTPANTPPAQPPAARKISQEEQGRLNKLYLFRALGCPPELRDDLARKG